MEILKKLIVLGAVVICLNLVNIEATKALNCADKEMDKCNKIVKKALQKQDKYCKAMGKLLDCTEKIKMGKCDMDELKNYRYVVVSYITMDKLMGNCDTTISQAFIDEILGSRTNQISRNDGFSAVALQGSPSVTMKAREAHTLCLAKFAAEESDPTSDNLCTGVSDFIQCYQDNKDPDDPVSDAFAALVKDMSTSLIAAFGQKGICRVTDEL